MARNIYQSQLSKIKDLRKLRSVPAFAREVQKMARQVNQRLYRLEQKGIGTGDTAYRYAQKETGKEKPRYSTNLATLESMTIQELYEISIQLNAKIVSKTSTIKGLAEVEEKRLQLSEKELFKEVFEGEDRESWRTFLNTGGGELLNSKYLSSTQIAEDWDEFVKNGGVSAKELIDIYKKEMDKSDIDYGQLRRDLIKLNQKNLAEKEKE